MRRVCRTTSVTPVATTMAATGIRRKADPTAASFNQAVASSSSADVPAEAPLTIAIDAMGGDFAPTEVVKGSVEYARSGDAYLLLVGDPARIEPELASYEPEARQRISIFPASQVIEMQEHPAEAVRQKPDASLVVCARLVHDGVADGTFTAGHTGAAMVAAISVMGRIGGVRRPAIATLLPTELRGKVVVVDVGANTECRASDLVQFGLMGSIYAERALGVRNPRVGLLSNGEEETKGNRLTLEALPQLSRLPIHFLGNIEGNHVFEGVADVVVCDGFTGNILLKGAEGAVRMSLTLLAGDARRISEEHDQQVLLSNYSDL